jgi:hypothetical protein
MTPLPGDAVMIQLYYGSIATKDFSGMLTACKWMIGDRTERETQARG